MKHIFYNATFLIVPFLICIIACQDAPSDRVNWVNWEEWDAKEKLGDRKGLVWIHSPSCDDCIEMKEKVFGHPVIIDYINTYYYAAKLDVDYQEPIFLKGKTWKYISSLFKQGQGYHELAAALLGKQEGDNISYPSIAFLDENFSLIIAIKKNVTAKELEVLLAFIYNDYYKEMNIEQFQKKFKSKITEQ